MDNSDRKGFLATLGEVCEKCGFVVHSYVVMHNHWQASACETPAGNLVAGMKRFQEPTPRDSTLGIGWPDTSFAGRYKAVLVDRGDDYYGRLVSD